MDIGKWSAAVSDVTVMCCLWQSYCIPSFQHSAATVTSHSPASSLTGKSGSEIT